MAGERFRFREQRIKVAVAVDDEVVFAPSAERAVTVVNRWSVEDRDNVSTSVRTVVRGRGGVDVPLNEARPVGAGYLYWDTEETFINDGEQLVAAFVGVTIGDVLVLNVEGEFRPLED